MIKQATIIIELNIVVFIKNNNNNNIIIILGRTDDDDDDDGNKEQKMKKSLLRFYSIYFKYIRRLLWLLLSYLYLLFYRRHYNIT